MNKEKRSRDQLAEMVMEEAKAIGKRSDLREVQILRAQLGYANWETDVLHRSARIPTPCRVELPLIIGRLQTLFDLADSV
jgi:hypothetical protein